MDAFEGGPSLNAHLKKVGFSETDMLFIKSTLMNISVLLE